MRTSKGENPEPPMSNTGFPENAPSIHGTTKSRHGFPNVQRGFVLVPLQLPDCREGLPVRVKQVCFGRCRGHRPEESEHDFRAQKLKTNATLLPSRDVARSASGLEARGPCRYAASTLQILLVLLGPNIFPLK